MIAILVERGLPHEKIARLTPRQIMDHYFYPRDEQGNLKMMDRECTIPDEITDADADAIALAIAASIGADDAAIRETIRQRELKKTNGDAERQPG